MPLMRQFWLEFLELYKNNSCLWDVKNSSYTRRDLRNKSYNILLEKYREINPTATMDMVKKKIDVFRTGFRREWKKINEQRDNCSSEGIEYQSTLWYYDTLSFLDFEGADQKSIVKESNESDDPNDPNEIEYIDIPDDFSTPKPIKRNNMKRRKVEDSRVSLEEPHSYSYISTEEDDCSIYCASLKLQMRELETEQKYIAQKLISDVIFLARTSQLTLDSSVS